MSSRRHNIRPVIVEVQPDIVPSVAPSSPSNASKSVRFAPTSEYGSSRPLTSIEAWSLYNFEVHARSCSTCYQPRANHLCDTGDALSRDVACHIFSRDSEIYAVRKDSSKLVRVEIPHGYTQLRQLLSSMERRLRSHEMSAPTSIDYTQVYPTSSTRRKYVPDQDVYIQPAQTHRRSKSHRYSTVVANGDVEDVTILPMPSSERRGTLYEREAQRRKENVRIEVREPDVKETGRRHRRRSVWL
ncbi:hypothetical protein Slin15195_G014720 [Septoria linicola]|uniref:Uncharacterized protein n=1 Tax=Septoria linicola TaxID=215465 RepID=A0A9Q9EGD0_9PEZI|nr:hypothetical protein Slin14017_G014750 [Septoria linicola]USW48153.1 hypothetical protein Slin15195_G014720 [Septoria linicola]